MNRNFTYRPESRQASFLHNVILFISTMIFFSNVSAQCPTGNVVLNTQAQVNAFLTNYPNCTQINGNLSIVSSPSNSITDLSPLSNITTVNGTLNVTNTAALPNLSGLSGLTTIGINFYIDNNTGLQSINGMNSLQTVGGFLYVINNPALQNFNGLNNLQSLGAGFWFNNNDALTQFQAFDDLTTISGPIVIVQNTNLNSLLDFSGVTSNQSFVHIEHNLALTSIYGLHNLNAANISFLYLLNCPQLSICGVQSVCDYLNSGTSNFLIHSNAPGCLDKPDIQENCVYQPAETPGCMNAAAHNYNPLATVDDGSCETCSDNVQNGDETGVDCGGSLCDPCIVYGCTDPLADNYNPNANQSNGSCLYCHNGILDGNEITVDCGGGCDEDCPDPPFVPCADVILYVDQYNPDHEGATDDRDIFLKGAIFFVEGVTYDGPYFIATVKRKSDYLKHDWTTEGACIDGLPNGDKDDVDKGKVYRDCIPLVREDINDGERKYQLHIWSFYGSYACIGNYWVDTLTNANYAVPEIQIATDEEHDVPSPAKITGRSESEFLSNVQAIPNPGVNIVYVTWHTTSIEPVRLIISDMSGRIFSDHSITSLAGTNQLQLDMSRFNAGLYIITLQKKNSLESTRWVKSE